MSAASRRISPTKSGSGEDRQQRKEWLCSGALPFRTFAEYTQPQENLIGAEATRPAPLMPLSELVRLYLQHSGEFGKPVAISAFGLPSLETEKLFSGYDEDYHISRFFQFSEAGGQRFSINGIYATHVAIDREIETIL